MKFLIAICMALPLLGTGFKMQVIHSRSVLTRLGATLIDPNEENVVVNKLAELGLSAETYQHEKVFTVEEQTEQVGSLPGAMTKNLFLKDKKHGIWLVTAAAERKINTKTFAKMLNLTPKPNFSFGKEDLLEGALGVTTGSVTPFAMMNDGTKQVTFCMDKSLMDEELINVHPLRNDRTTSIKPADVVTFIKSYGHEVRIVDFDEEV